MQEWADYLDTLKTGGPASRDEVPRTGEYFDAASVHAELRGMLAKSSGGNAKR
jgi:hypothetical protein